MLRSLLLVCCLNVIGITGRAQSFPPFQEIIEHFFDSYEAPRELWRLQFEKRPDGYYLAYLERPRQIKERHLIYSNGVFQPINGFPSITAPMETPQSTQRHLEYFNVIGDFQLAAYDRQPYYGYPGWYQDAIKWAEQQDELSNDELHALARAYSVATMALLANHSGYAIPEDIFIIPSEAPSLNEAQLQQYLTLANKTLDTYQELAQRDPGFMTPIGPIATKSANERMHIFLTLLQFQDEQTAKSILKGDLYDEYLLSQGRNYLRSCPSNSVLISYGDTDTYVPLYLQAVEGIRTDVIIANLSLLETSRYRNFLYRGPLGALPIRTALPSFREETTDQTYYWLPLPDNQEDTIVAEEFVALLYEQARQGPGMYPGVYSLATKYVQIPPPTNSSLIDLIPGYQLTTVEWQIFTSKNFLTPGNLFCWNIVYGNEWKRPLCFMPTVRTNNLRAWVSHLAHNGLVYQVFPHNFPENTTITLPVFTPASFQFWENSVEYMTNFEITALDKLPFYQHQISNAKLLIDHLIQAEQTKEAEAFLQKLPKRFPNEIHPWGQFWIGFIEQAQQLGLDETADIIMETISVNIKNDDLPHTSPSTVEWMRGRLRVLQN